MQLLKESKDKFFTLVEDNEVQKDDTTTNYQLQQIYQEDDV